VREGGFASNRLIGRSFAGTWDENRNASRSSQFENQVISQQKKRPGTLFSIAYGLKNTQNPEFQRLRSIPEGLIPLASTRWLALRSFSADAQSASERKGLPETQIGEELLSETQNEAPGLKLADGETLSPEEVRILKEAEAEFESAQQSKGAS